MLQFSNYGGERNSNCGGERCAKYGGRILTLEDFPLRNVLSVEEKEILTVEEYGKEKMIMLGNSVFLQCKSEEDLSMC